MGVFEHFPYTNFHDLNLDWIAQELEKLSVDVRDFISINAIKYADPIQWDITSQYEKNTVVLDKNGNAYLSVQPVPAGVSLDRTEYWTNIGNFSALWESVKSAITVPDEGHEKTASAPRAVNDLVWVNNQLLEVTAPMIAGDRYIVGSNCRVYSMQILLTETLEAFKKEAEERALADNTLSQKIQQEAKTREQADETLSQQIENVPKYVRVPASNDDQTNFIQTEIVDKNAIGILDAGGHIINTITLTTGHSTLHLIGQNGASVNNDIVVDGSNVDYYAGKVVFENVSFSGSFTAKSLSPFDFSIFNGCRFQNTFIFDGSRHFAFNECVWRKSDSSNINEAITIRNNAFNGDCLFTNCEFLCNTLAKPYFPESAEPYSEWRGMHFTNCYFYGGGGPYGYLILDLDILRVLDWWFTDCQFDQIAKGPVIYIHGQDADKGIKGNIYIDGVQIVNTNPTDDAIIFENCNNSVIANCEAANLTITGASKKVMVNGNNIKQIKLIAANKCIICNNANESIVKSGAVECVIANNLVNE